MNQVPDVDAWLGDTQPLANWRGQEERAHDTARIIADKPSVITVIRAGIAQAAQTVRVDLSRNSANRYEVRNEAGSVGSMTTQIIGYKGHPTITDTDLKRGDQFYLGTALYRVTMVYPDLDDRLLAFAEVVR
jgi:hypothetical protein